MAPVMGPSAPGTGISNMLILTKIPEGISEQQLAVAIAQPADILKMTYRPADIDGPGWAFIAFAAPHMPRAARDRLNGKPMPGGPPTALIEASLGEGLYGEYRPADGVNNAWKEARSPQGHTYYYHAVTKQVSWTKPPPDLNPIPPAPAPGARPPQMATGPMGRPGVPTPPPGVPTPPPPPGAAAVPESAPARRESSQAGPVGANLFIYHVPNSWDDAILRQHFEHFGTLVSCRVQKDPDGRPRGFGFVSYDSPTAAQAAIVGMHAFPVEGKHLKVQLKKGDEQQIDKATPLANLGGGPAILDAPGATGPGGNLPSSFSIAGVDSFGPMRSGPMGPPGPIGARPPGPY